MPGPPRPKWNTPDRPDRRPARPFPRAPDVVLLDIGLPGMNGYEVAKRMRQMPSLAATGLVALTGYGQENDKAASAEAGFDAHLVKPVDFVELVETIESLKESNPEPKPLAR